METRGGATAAAATQALSTTLETALGTSTTHDQILGPLLPTLEPEMRSQLPSNGDVLRHYVFLTRGPMKYKSKQDIVTTVLNKIQLFWDDAGIATTPMRGGKSKKLLTSLVVKLETTKKHKSRDGTVNNFKQIFCEELFDIAHAEASHLIDTDRKRTEKAKKEDKLFLIDQRTARLQCLGTLDRKYSQKVKTKQTRLLSAQDFKVRMSQSTHCQQESTTDLSDILSEDETSLSASSSDEFTSPSPLKRQRTADSITASFPNLLQSPEFHEAADRFKLSLRARTAMAGVVHLISGTDLDEVNCSINTARRAAQQMRQDTAETIKAEFVAPCHTAVHFDTKKVKDTCGSSGKVDRLVMSASGPPIHTEGKFLHACNIGTLSETGMRMGRSEAIAVHGVCEDWNLIGSLWAMVFDTTATNSGHISGSCTIFERDLVGKKMLWCACNHHKDERILHAVFRSLFGDSTSPENQAFLQFRDVIWKELDTSSDYQTLHIQSRQLKSREKEVITFYEDILTNSDGSLPRDDYRELAEIMLQLLGVDPPRGCRWYKPGGVSNVRWMASILYSAKIVAFSDQLELDEGVLELYTRFVLFCALYYVPWWLVASKGIDAPIHDLEFWNAMQSYKKGDPDVADAAITALERHLWYLTEEMAPISLFSDKLTNADKSAIAKEILKQKGK